MTDIAAGNANAEPNNDQHENLLANHELRLKEEELRIRWAELQQKKEENDKSKSKSSTPLTIAIVTGVIGLIGAIVANILQSNSTLKLEQEKFKASSQLESKQFESSLILKAIETGNPESATKNLLFLLHAGLIKDKNGLIARLAATPEEAPVLPANRNIPIPVPVSESSQQLFFKKYQESFGKLAPGTLNALKGIFQSIEQEKSLYDVRQIAYILASIKFETANTFVPTEEAGEGKGHRYGEKNKRSGEHYTTPNKLYYGRGYFQLTWYENYENMNRVLKLEGSENDILLHPEKALDPVISYKVAAYAFVNGTFTGKKISDYINDKQTDYINARKIINGLSSATLIANDAKIFEKILRETLGIK
jgi:hypothetical protein